MANSQRTKLALKDLGDPAMVKTLPEKDRDRGYFLGTVAGIASGFATRKNDKDGTTMEGLAGTFRMIPSVEDRDTLESGILWIPDAFHNMIAAELRNAQKTDENATVSFAFEVTSITAKNPAGYSWDFRPLAKPGAANPLDEFLASVGEVKMVAGRRVLAIEDQSAKPKAPVKK